MRGVEEKEGAAERPAQQEAQGEKNQAPQSATRSSRDTGGLPRKPVDVNDIDRTPGGVADPP